jgi:hypothetical protein
VHYVPVYAADVLVGLLNGRSLAPTMIAALGLLAGVFTVVWLLRRYDFDDTFEHGRDIPLFAATALIGMLIPAAVGAGTFAAWYAIDLTYHSAWTLMDRLRWWLNDFMDALIQGPLLVAARWKALRPRRAQPISASLLLLLLLTLERHRGTAVHSGPNDGRHDHQLHRAPGTARGCVERCAATECRSDAGMTDPDHSRRHIGTRADAPLLPCVPCP